MLMHWMIWVAIETVKASLRLEKLERLVHLETHPDLLNLDREQNSPRRSPHREQHHRVSFPPQKVLLRLVPDKGEEVLHRAPLLNSPDLTESSFTQSSHLLADFPSSGHILYSNTKTT